LHPFAPPDIGGAAGAAGDRDMDALYMIIAFVVVMALLNVISTGRVD
jgi:hypothetical protein